MTLSHNPHDSAFPHPHEHGITIRDYFAAKAMQALVHSLPPDDAADRAYEFADAMFAKRRRDDKVPEVKT